MRLTILSSTFLAICFLSGPIVAAQESVERLREKAMAVREEAKAAAERGEKRRAAEHLKLAEAHDLAHQLMEKADVMEREVQDGKRRLAEEMQKQRGEPEGMDVVQDLRVEVAKLRAEIKELRAKLMNRDE